jgi:hypothetical protein
VPDFNTLSQFVTGRKIDEERTRALRLQADAEIARRAAKVTDHPGWALFVEEVSRLKGDAARRRAGFADEMGRDGVVGDRLMTVKLQHARADEVTRMLEHVLGLIPALIEKGEQAVRELKG